MGLQDSNKTSTRDNAIIEIESGDGSGNAASVNASKRLLVDAVMGVMPSGSLVPKVVQLFNGAAREMNVNGSITPQYFSYSPAAGETWLLEKLVFYLSDVGTMDELDFGSISGGITNGLELSITTLGVNQVVANYKNNLDLYLSFGNVRTKEATAGLFSIADVALCEFDFRRAVKLSGTSDFVKFKVQDNLTALGHCLASVYLMKGV